MRKNGKPRSKRQACMEEVIRVPREGEVLPRMPRAPRPGYAWAGGEEVKLVFGYERRKLEKRPLHDDLLGDIEVEGRTILTGERHHEDE